MRYGALSMLYVCSEPAGTRTLQGCLPRSEVISNSCLCAAEGEAHGGTQGDKDLSGQDN